MIAWHGAFVGSFSHLCVITTYSGVVQRKKRGPWFCSLLRYIAAKGAEREGAVALYLPLTPRSYSIF